MARKLRYVYIGRYSDFAAIFFRVPKVLFYEKAFERLDNHDKMAYSLMLDRASLSAKNGWVDAEGHVFIYFTIAEACRVLKLGKTKVEKIFSVLTEVGLIERVRQGFGRPVRIYVMDIVAEDDNEVTEACDALVTKMADEEEDDGAMATEVCNVIETCDGIATDVTVICEDIDTDVRGTCDGIFTEMTGASRNAMTDNRETVECVQAPEIHRRPFGERPDDRETVSNKTDINNTEFYNPIISYPSGSDMDGTDMKNMSYGTVVDGTDVTKALYGTVVDGTDVTKASHGTVTDVTKASDGVVTMRETCEKLIRNHIGYGYFRDVHPGDLSLVDGMVNLIVDVVMADNEVVVIGGMARPGVSVRQRFMRLGLGEIEYVVHCMRRVSSNIRNIRKYLLAALYNAPDTIDAYYRNLYACEQRKRAAERVMYG